MGIMDGGTPGDWISPLVHLFGDLLNGPGYMIGFTKCHMTPPEVKRLLNTNGIKAWAPEILDGQGCVTVKKAEAGRACQLLQSARSPGEQPAEIAKLSEGAASGGQSIRGV